MADKPVPKPEDLRIYRGLTLSADSLPTAKEQKKHLDRIPPPPPWRSFSLSPEEWTKAAKSQKIPPEQGKIDPRALGFVADKKAVELVNAALCLRRPLLIEGNPGAGKTSLAYAVAR
ncbi:MAG: ATPase, partial [Microcystis aeruginosa]